MKWRKLTTLTGMLFLIVLTCMFGACSTSQNTKTGDNTSTLNGVPATSSAQLKNPTSPIKAIRMLDHSKGWALTDQNILLTVDGGQQWKDVTPGSIGKIDKGTFMNDKYAWVVSTGQTGVNVWHTSNGGQQWQSSTISVNGAEAVSLPDFLTPQEGFLEISAGGPGAGSEPASIYHTTDSGQNWTLIAELPQKGIKTGISFQDTQSGWATGEDASATPWLYATHDGGYTWKPQLLVNAPGFNGTASTNVHYTTTPPVFFGNNGFLPLQIQGQLDTSQVNGIMILKSTDGGISWSTDWKSNPSTLTSFASSDLYIESTHNAWATDQDGNVYATSDASENWVKLASNVDTIKALSFVDASYGWAVSDTKLWQTTDGGSHWSQIAYQFIA